MKSLLVFALIPACSVAVYAIPITIQVSDSQDLPTIGATVQIELYGKPGAASLVQTTDAQGQAKFDLEPNPDRPDFIAAATVWKPGYALAGALVQNSGAKIKLNSGVAFHGRIVDSNKKPLEGVTVDFSRAQPEDPTNWSPYIYQGPLRKQFETKSDAKGQFSFNDMPDKSNIWLSITDPRFVTTQINGRAGAEEIQIVVRPSATLKGQLLTSDGKPLSDIDVVAQPVGQNEGSAQAKTDAQGNYVLSGLTTGSYNVLFKSPAEAEFVVPAIENVSAVEEQTTSLPGSRSQAGAVVSGLVRDETTKNPIANAMVEVYGPQNPTSSGLVVRVTTDAQGLWKSRVVPGNNVFRMREVPKGYQATPQEKTVEVDEDGTTQVNFDLKPAIAIRGQFVDEKGQPVKTSLVVRQKWQEWPVVSDETGQFEAFGPTEGEVTFGPSSWNLPDKKDMPWDVVQGDKATLPAHDPLKIVLRPTQFLTAEGRVLDETGKPVADAQVTMAIITGLDEGATSTNLTLTTDAQGHFINEKLRSGQTLDVKAAKTDYDFVSGGKATKVDGQWKVEDIVLQARTGRVTGRVINQAGQGVSGVSVFAADVETQTDASGAFVLDKLPAAGVEVIAWKDEDFALLKPTDAKPVEIRLQKQTLQPQDINLAREVLGAAKKDAEHTDYWGKDSLRLYNDGDFATQLAQAQQLPAQDKDHKISELIYRMAGQQDIPVTQLIEAVKSISDSTQQLFLAGILFAKRPDWPQNEANKTFVEQLKTSAAEQWSATGNDWMRATGLFGVAGLLDKFEGAEAGDLAFNQASAYVLRHFAEKGSNSSTSQDDIFTAMSGIFATGSPRLYNRLISEMIDPESSGYVRALKQGAVALARTQGIEAAIPLLEELKKAPKPKPDSYGNVTSVSNELAQATRQAIMAGGAKSPQKAIELAQALSTDTQNGGSRERDRAIAEAAFFLPLEQARPLWLGTMTNLDPGQAISYAKRIAAKDNGLALEILKRVRQKIDDADKTPYSPIWGGESNVAAFAFYESDFNPAQARYRLEKAWVVAKKEKDNTWDWRNYLQAMSKIDAGRAIEWAKEFPQTKDGIQSNLEARRKVAQWLEADEQTRSKVDFSRWAYNDLWSMDDEY